MTQGELEIPKTELTAYTRPSARYYTLGILTVVYSFNFIDRQLLSILQEPIKQDLLLADWQLGLLTGVGFALLYTFVGIPLARLADRSNRRNIISWSLAIWSLMTALSGLAQNYWHLLAARVGVGIGEAGCSPPAHSMISDIFPANKRATALSVYSTGINIGILFGFLLGGWLNEFFGWRVAFMVVGLPGVALALFVRFTIVEPPRGFSQAPDMQENPDPDPGTFSDAMKLLWSCRSFRHLAFGGSLTAFAAYAMINWIASFIIRTHGMNTGELGTWLAATSVFGAIGTLSAGIIADRLARKDSRWYMWVPACAALIMGPSFAACVMMDNVYATLAINCIPTFVATFYVGSCIAMIHALVGQKNRALGSAIFFFILNIIGLGLGPFSVGVLSDFLEPGLGTESLRYALVIIVPTIASWSAIHFFLASRHLREDLENAPP